MITISNEVSAVLHLKYFSSLYYIDCCRSCRILSVTLLCCNPKRASVEGVDKLQQVLFAVILAPGLPFETQTNNRQQECEKALTISSRGDYQARRSAKGRDDILWLSDNSHTLSETIPLRLPSWPALNLKVTLEGIRVGGELVVRGTV